VFRGLPRTLGVRGSQEDGRVHIGDPQAGATGKKKGVFVDRVHQIFTSQRQIHRLRKRSVLQNGREPVCTVRINLIEPLRLRG